MSGHDDAIAESQMNQSNNDRTLTSSQCQKSIAENGSNDQICSFSQITQQISFRFAELIGILAFFCPV
jgi:hypothetical protein